MRLLFVADGRSPTALSWLSYWIEKGYEIHLISTYPCRQPDGLASFHLLPVAFSSMAASQVQSKGETGGGIGLVARSRAILRYLRYIFGPIDIWLRRDKYRAIISKIQPQLIHALRIPFEGMLAASTPRSIPLVVSIWGNDLTLHAHGSPMMRRLTRKALSRAAGLMADTERDVRLALEWGYSPEKPALIIPGSGGIRMSAVNVDGSKTTQLFPQELPDGPIVVNPRGSRPGSLRQDLFLQAIPLVLEKVPAAFFICPALAADMGSRNLVESLGIGSKAWLWPKLSQPQLWDLYRKSQVFVSPSVHDGTPNSLLEAMACGCFPVVGNIESMREWITQDSNGCLVDANSSRSIADGIIHALENPALQKEARNKNASLIAQRAEYQHCMATAEAFLRTILNGEVR